MREGPPEFIQPEKNPEEEIFEKQFNNPEILDIEGHELRILDLKPLETKSDTPVVIEGGYGTYSPLHNKANILEMARRERRTIFIDEPRGIEPKNSKEKDKNQEIEEFFLRQTEALLVAMDKKEIEKIDLVGHSEGCVLAAVAASLYPERFRNLVLFDPGGVIENDSLLKLSYRFLTEGLQELKRNKKLMSEAAREQAKEGMRGFQKYLMEDKTKSIEELRSLARAQIRDLLKKAHEEGVRISIVHGVDDKVFPMEHVQKAMSRENSENELFIDGFYSVKGTHAEFIMKPEQFTGLADSALTALEKKAAL